MKSDGNHLSTLPSPSFSKLFFGALGGCMLVFSVFPATLLREAARQDILWNRMDTVALLVDLLGIALAVAAALWALGRATRGRALRRARCFLPFLYAVGLMQFLPQEALRNLHLDVLGIFTPYAAIAGVGFALSLAACRGRLDGLLRFLGAFLPAFALICPMLALQLLRSPPFHAVQTLNGGPVPEVTSPNPNILVFSFDSMPMMHCVGPGGDWRGDLPRMRAFQDRAIRFDAARSAGDHTLASVPAFLFQDERGIYKGTELADNAWWKDSLLGVDATAHTNGILAMARSAGYRTAALTLYLPLGQLAGGLLDEVWDMARIRYFPATSFANRCLNQLAGMVDCVRPRPDGLARATKGRFPWPPHRFATDYFALICREQLDAVHAHIARLPASGELFYAHLVGAHEPYVFLEDGSTDEPTASYDSQLRYTDSVFGGILDDLERRDRHDGAWIIFTSDHGRHHSDETTEEHRHVPFVVKPPNWSRPIVSDTPLGQWELSDFFRAIMEGTPVEECVDLLLAAGGREEAASPSPPDPIHPAHPETE